MVATFRVPSVDFNYVPSDEDVTWAAVALYGETRGHNNEAEWGRILWTWMNRFMLHIPRPRVWPTLANLIMNHSQPVSPKWRRGGSRCMTANSGNCSDARLEWRQRMAELIDMGFPCLAYIPADMADFILRFFNGEVPQEFGDEGLPLVDFGVTANATAWGTQYGNNGNFFLTALQSQKAALLHNFLTEAVVVINGGGSSIPVNDYSRQQLLPELKYVVVGLWGVATLTAFWYLLKPRG